MLIPPVCMSCGSQISHLWRQYQALVLKYSDDLDENKFKVVKPNKKMLVEATPECKALKDLGLNKPDRICCARMLLTHVDISDDID